MATVAVKLYPYQLPKSVAADLSQQAASGSSTWQKVAQGAAAGFGQTSSGVGVTFQGKGKTLAEAFGFGSSDDNTSTNGTDDFGYDDLDPGDYGDDTDFLDDGSGDDETDTGDSASNDYAGDDGSGEDYA